MSRAAERGECAYSCVGVAALGTPVQAEMIAIRRNRLSSLVGRDLRQ